MADVRTHHDSSFVPVADGEVTERMRAHDCSTSPLGSIATWPQSLRTSVELLLASRHGMHLVWGPELTFLYNDAYAPCSA